ncbi:lipid droplet-associated protein [Prauserella alba]|uniref:lipid droplet-associated protein n=2 Tax=Prauserella alba TaxID=176898 RepID=UPI0020A42083|nr:lipid droplet-associated protein [Prauserella alba]
MKHFPFPVRVAAGLAASTADTVRDLPKHLTELPVTVASQVLQTSMRVQQHVTELAIKGDDALAAFRGVDDEPNWATFDEDDDPEAAQADARAGVDAPGAAATFDDPWDAESQALGEEHEDGEFDSTDTRIAAAVGTDTPRGGGNDGGDGNDGGGATGTATGEGENGSADPTAGDTAAEGATTGAGAAPSAPSTTSSSAAASSAAASSAAASSTTSGPAGVDDYDALSLPELRSRLRSFSADELQQLLDYERDHENRPSFTGMLTRRIANVRAESGAQPEDGTAGDDSGATATGETATS